PPQGPIEARSRGRSRPCAARPARPPRRERVEPETDCDERRGSPDEEHDAEELTSLCRRRNARQHDRERGHEKTGYVRENVPHASSRNGDRSRRLRGGRAQGDARREHVEVGNEREDGRQVGKEEVGILNGGPDRREERQENRCPSLREERDGGSVPPRV